MDSGGVFFLMRHTPNEVISGEKALITFLSNLNRSLLRLHPGAAKTTTVRWLILEANTQWKTHGLETPHVL